jgi:DNA polymerase I
MTYVVIDLETSIKCPVGTFQAHPMWMANRIVMAGIKAGVWKDVTVLNYPREGLLRFAPEAYEMVVGHNIKFDLAYIYRTAGAGPLPTIWDTQLAEYLLSGQQHKYASLDELTEQYVGKHALKDDKIKAYWKAGVQTEDIPEDELREYLIGDVTNTEQIFLQQIEIAKENGMLPLIMTQMDALRATIQMYLNGMTVDWDYVTNQRDEYTLLITHQLGRLDDLAPGLDWQSTKVLSNYFFGGEEKYVERELVGVYKNGKDKYKNVEKIREIKGKYDPKKFDLEKGKSGNYPVDDAVLQRLADVGDYVAETISKLRKYSKIKETYYENLLGLRMLGNEIFPNLNHTATSTGRLSCTQPNLQNQTDEGDVKRAYVSRYGKDGSILELDYSQLEMVGLAYIANDRQLIDDINSGRDMHRELYKEMYGRYPTDAERKPFKRFSFLLVYGGGVTTLMAQSGCDRDTAKRFINTFYKRYKGVKDYHETILKQAEEGKAIHYEESVSGPQYTYWHRSPTGRSYVFKQYPSEYKKGLSFSPTELKNYPIQGFATGDVVPMMVGLLQRLLDNLDNGSKLVMTVHDSVILDVPNNVLYNTAKEVKQLMESAPHYLKSFFNIDFPCSLKCGVEAGPSWQDKADISKDI